MTKFRLTALPYALILQYKNAINVFLLVVSVFQFIPQTRVGDPMNFVIPYSFIISLGMLKEMYMDYKRHVHDKKNNKAKCQVYSP